MFSHFSLSWHFLRLPLLQINYIFSRSYRAKKELGRSPSPSSTCNISKAFLWFFLNWKNYLNLSFPIKQVGFHIQASFRLKKIKGNIHLQTIKYSCHREYKSELTGQLLQIIKNLQICHFVLSLKALVNLLLLGEHAKDSSRTMSIVQFRIKVYKNFSILKSCSNFLNGWNTYLAQNYGNYNNLVAKNALLFYFKILFGGKKSVGVLGKHIQPKNYPLHNSDSPLIL